MADEEDDYMSEKFLEQDHKPGLMPKCFLKKQLRKESAKVKQTLYKKPSLKVKEAEQREKQLNVALDESNKGFAMLAKMGYKKGMGLGKEEKGRTEPVPVQIKAGRKGLGKEEQEITLKRQRVQTYVHMQKKRKEMGERLMGDFKNRVRGKQSDRVVMGDLRKSQQICEQLDSTKELEPPQPWYWPTVQDEEECDEEYEEDFEKPQIGDQLHLITYHLRRVHYYCIWCATTFNDEEDMNSHCPGSTRQMHDEEDLDTLDD